MLLLFFSQRILFQLHCTCAALQQHWAWERERKRAASGAYLSIQSRPFGLNRSPLSLLSILQFTNAFGLYNCESASGIMQWNCIILMGAEAPVWFPVNTVAVSVSLSKSPIWVVQLSSIHHCSSSLAGNYNLLFSFGKLEGYIKWPLIACAP